MSRLLRVLAAVAALVFGALCGAATLLVHSSWWGLVLGGGAGLAVSLAVPRGWVRFAYAVGWGVVVGWASAQQVERDRLVLIQSDGAGYALLVVTMVLVMLSIVTAPPPRRRAVATPLDPPS